jgi:hypothetical protein
LKKGAKAPFFLPSQSMALWVKGMSTITNEVSDLEMAFGLGTLKKNMQLRKQKSFPHSTIKKCG